MAPNALDTLVGGIQILGESDALSGEGKGEHEEAKDAAHPPDARSEVLSLRRTRAACAYAP